MGGPRTQRANVSTAPLPGLTGQAETFLQDVFSNPNFFQQFTGGGGSQPTSALQQQVGNTFQRLLTQQSPEQRTAEFGGANVIGAAQPIFQRNLDQAISTQREFGGPRFAAESGRQARQLSTEALQDFNLFQQNVLESGLNRQLQARGQDIQSLLGAGQFTQGQQQLAQSAFGQQLGFLLPLLQAGLQAGGAFSAPVITQTPGTFDQLTGAVGGVGGTLASAGLFG